MTLPRRRFLHLAAGAAALPATSRIASAEAYPTRPVRLVVGFAAGGPTDILGRLMGQWLSQRLGQPFIVENRPGAGGNLATEAVVNAQSDGHTLLLVAPANSINTTLYDNLCFNFMRDIVPVGSIMRAFYVMEVNPALPVQSVPQFIAYAKAHPGEINMASAGSGTPQHVAGELFKLMTGVQMVHVPYRGSAPALTDLMGGRVQVMFDNLISSLELIKAGRLRPLAVTTTARAEALPEIPTVGDFVPGFEASALFGLGAPRATPAEVVAKLNTEINAGVADPKITARLAELAGVVLAGSPADFGKLIADETEKWGKVVRFSGAKPD
ncbi:MAG TPA: tripartite tricarboxylate transporter substrate binding protein [Xanthobacteraceae bacterium]|nr:tripartite tricarboxylate transporter substrate binding protein [Xanthobacteraceae bacterium]